MRKNSARIRCLKVIDQTLGTDETILSKKRQIVWFISVRFDSFIYWFPSILVFLSSRPLFGRIFFRSGISLQEETDTSLRCTLCFGLHLTWIRLDCRLFFFRLRFPLCRVFFVFWSEFFSSKNKITRKSVIVLIESKQICLNHQQFVLSNQRKRIFCFLCFETRKHQMEIKRIL